MASEPENPIVTHGVRTRPDSDGSPGRGDFIDPPSPSNARVALAASRIRDAVRGLSPAECEALDRLIKSWRSPEAVQPSRLDRLWRWIRAKASS